MNASDETHLSAFHYGNSLPSVISAAKLLRLKTGLQRILHT